MRTWTLERQWSGSIVVGGNTEKLSIHGPVEVIELEPVLDLLQDLQTEMFILATGHSVDGSAGNKADDLLRAHGRLDG